MDFKQYLINQKTLQLKAVAELMYPDNKNANVYLSMKLKGVRNWTEKDNQRARQAIKSLGDKLINDTL